MPTDVRDAITSSTVEVGDEGRELPRARFLVLVRAVDDPVSKAAEIEAALAPIGATVRPLSTLDPRVLAVTLLNRVFVADADAFAAAYVLRDAFNLETAEPDLPTNFFPEADGPRGQKDPQTESVSGFCFTGDDPTLDVRWALKTMRVEEAWAFSIAQQRPDRGVGIVVAQPDTGITDHAELRDVPRLAPRDVLDSDNDPTDPLDDVGNPGHGTGTGSVVISPETGAVAGSAPRATHMPIRAIKSVIRITQGTVAEAIDWAVDHGAHVVTMSLGGIPSFALHRAVRRAVAADVIVLAAAGNCVRLVVFPARYEDCIAVAAIDAHDQAWRGSCRGDAVDISAPGENVFRARVGDPAVGQGQGTSFAVALTAGVAALWLAHHGRANVIAGARARGETVQKMFQRLLMATARRPPGWNSFDMGAGVADARDLLEASFDLNRGLESAPQPNDTAERTAVAVQSLVLESLGEAALAPQLDWVQFGPEVATAIFRAQMAAPIEGGREAALSAVALSMQLEANAAAEPLLRRLRGAAS